MRVRIDLRWRWWRMLRNDLSGSVSGNVVQAGSVAEIHFHRRPPAGGPSIPSQLPAVTRAFASRTEELEGLRRWRETARRAPLATLSGPAGVGKTTLALRWLHELRDAYPDGQLFVDLGGAQQIPAVAADVLDWFLVSLGVPARRIPVEPGRREALYRTETAGRRLVVLLDNAVSASQVRPLIPAGDQCLAVVTSRSRLSGLAMEGAHWLQVDPLDEAGSVNLLREMLGAGRVCGEADAARELGELCGGLPLALSMVAARLATRPRRRLAREVADLRVERRRLDSLTLADGGSVEAALDVSYKGLDDDAATLYRLCAAHPGREFGTDVTAAATAWSAERAELTVDTLVEANFLAEVSDGRFAYHDLVRLHAQRRAGLENTAEQRTSGLRRMAEWYLRRAVAADLAVHPLRQHLGPCYAEPGGPQPAFAGVPEALAWLEIERRNLRAVLDAAAAEHWHELVWQLCEALWGFFLHTRHYGEWIEMQRTGIASTRRCVNRRAEARLRSQLGFAYAKLGRYADAAAENTDALRLAEAVGDEQAAATALSQLGRAARGTGDLDAALRYYRRSRDIQQRLGRWRGVALCRRRIGDVLGRLGRFGDAFTELRAAAEAMHQLGDRTQHARTLMFLGSTRLRAGQVNLAERTLHEALALVRDLGSPYYQAEVLARLGELAEQSGDTDSARQHYEEAGALYAGVEDPKADAIRARLRSLG
jgi:tetratricopeptide (TPR) repeat protein